MKQIYPQILFITLLLAGHFDLLAGKSEKLSDIFIENRGQVKSEKGAPVNDVLFYKGGPLQFFITSTGFSAMVKTTGKESTTYNKVDFKFTGVKISKQQVVFVAAQSAPINMYGPGKDILTGLKSSKTVIIKDIYPGIDWLWNIDDNGKVNHDFMVNLGADASIIKYTVNGANIDNSGGDILKYVNEKVRLREGPVVFKTREKDLAGQVLVKGNEVSFHISNELKKGGFTIDPPFYLEWSYGFDTVSHISFTSIIKDDSLNTFTVGYSSDFTTPTFPQSYGSFVIQNPDGGSQDAVIMKTDPNQNLVWATFFGGSNNDEANAVASSPTGIFVVGYSESWDFPQATLGNYNNPVALFNRDAFIAKFSSVGLLKWSTGYGGNKSDEAMDVKYYNGHIYVAGYTYSADFPTRIDSGAYFYHDTGLHNASDAFLLEFDTTANRIWATNFGGSGNDFFSSLSVDGSGIYITGYSDSIGNTTIPLVSNGPAYFQNSFQNTESFIVHFSDTNTLDWSTYFGGPGNDVASCIVHSNCKLMICGKTDGDGLPVMTQNNGNYYQTNYIGGGSDGFIAAFDPNTWQQVYGTYYGSGGYDALTKFSVDNSCNTVFTGFSNGLLPVTGDPLVYYLQNNINGGGFDGIMLALNNQQNAIWSTYFGSVGDDFGLSVAIIAFPIVDMVGTTFYNYGNDTIGGTYITNDSILLPYPDVTSNGVSNRFNLLWGRPQQGGGGPGCGTLLQFQKLIPLKNACPNQCNGEARIDIENVGGCPPIHIIWSNGDTSLLDSGLCNVYWNRIYDSLGQGRTLYGKFDVLRVPSVGEVTSFCGLVPDWSHYIFPQGGGPPYTIDYRGAAGDTCPITAYFNISDTAGCVVSFSVPWNQANTNVSSALSIDTGNCRMLVTTTFGGICKDFTGSQYWYYHLTKPNGDTLDFPFGDYGQNLVVPLTLGNLVGGNYSIYLVMGDCETSPATLFWVPAPQINVIVTQYCKDPAVVTISGSADSSVLQATGGYYETITFTESSTVFGNGYPSGDGPPLTFTRNFYFTPDTTNRTWIINPAFPEGVYTVSAVIIQSTSAEGKCATTTINSGAGGLVVLPFNSPGVCTGGGYISISAYYQYSNLDSLAINQIHYSYYWPSNGSTDSILYITQPGIYSCIVTSSVDTSCHVSVTDTIKFLYDSLALNEVPCGPGLFERARVFTNGGTPPYRFLWSSGETDTTANYLAQGADWIRVNDAGGCRDSINFANTKQLPIAATDVATNPLCFYSQDGSIALTPTYGYTPYQVVWTGNPANGFNPTGLKAGTYKYLITDSMGCKDSANIVLVKPDTMIYQVVNNSPAGCHANNGSVEIDATGGTGQLSIAWSDQGSGFIRDSLVTGTYSFTITDANGCSINGTVFIDSVITLNCFVTANNVLCYGTVSGSAYVNILQASYPVTYAWQYPNGPGPDSQIVANLGIGMYVVTVKDNSGCSFTDTFNLTQPDSLQASVYTFPASCTGANGYVQLFPTGGTADYNYTWSGSGNQWGNYLLNLVPGYYPYTITDNNGCVDTGSAIITDTMGLQPQLAALNSCAGASTGTAIVTVNDAYSSNYNFTWYYNFNQLPQTGSSITNAASGSYSVEITDDQGCDTTLYFSINDAVTDLAVTVDTGNGIQCYGSYANIDVEATGFNGPFTGTGFFQNYGGAQIYVVTDQTGCGVIDTVTVTPPAPLSSVVTTTRANCLQGLGTVMIQTTGGKGPYRVFYNGHNQTYTSRDTFTLPTGYYSIYVYDSNNCVQGYGVNIGFVNGLTAHVRSFNVVCHGDSTGSAQATVTSGNAPITYHWSNGSTTQNIQNLRAGIYSVTIGSAGGCTYDTTFTITQPALPINVTVDTGAGIACFGNSDFVNVFATGGTGHFTGTGSYNFYAGSHVVTVQDSIGCQVVAHINLWQPQILNTTASSVALGCSGGSGIIKLTTTGGVGSYSTFFNAQSFTYSDTLALNNVTPGQYTINVNDAHNCLSSASVTVQPDSGITANASATNPRCYSSNDGSITITVTAGNPPFYVNGNSFNSSYTIYNLGQGYYTDTVTSSGGCKTVVTAAVFAPLPFTGDASVVQDVLCSGNQGTVLISGNGGTQPYVGTGQYNFPGGNSSIVISDANGCQTSVNISLTNPAPLVGNYNIISPVTCNGGEAIVNVTASGGTAPYTGTGGYQFSAGGQQVVIGDANGCSTTFSFNVPQPTPLLVNYVIDQAAPCSQVQGQVTIYASGGQGPYAIVGFSNFNDSLVMSLGGGAYSYEIADNGGCTQAIAFTMPQSLQGVLASAQFIRAPECYVDTGIEFISINGGVPPYTLSNGLNTLTIRDTISLYLTASYYTYEVTDSVGCTDTFSFSFSPSESFTARVTNIGPPCFGYLGNVIIHLYGGAPPFNLNGQLDSISRIEIDGLPAGPYNFSITDSLGCEVDVYDTLTQTVPLIVDTSFVLSAPTCVGSASAVVEVIASGGTPQYSYTLLSGSQIIPEPDSVFTSVAPGAYRVVVLDAAGCLDTSSFIVPPFVPSTDSIVVDSALCFGSPTGAIKIYVLPANRNQYTYSLNGGTPQVYNVFYDLTANNYQVIVSDANNCKDTINVSIGQPDSIDGRVWLNDTLLPRDSIILNSQEYATFSKLSSNPWTVTFSPSTPYTINTDSVVQVQPQQSLTYTVTIYLDSNDRGCYIQYNGLIDVMFIPERSNTITPNGDGINDTWKIDLIKFPHSELTIFDRWGEILYTSTDYNNDWGGINQSGKKLPDGTYFYLLKVPSQNNAVYKGDINIVDAPR